MGSALFYSSGQAARELGTTQTRIRALCESRAIEATSTPGGQWRVAREEVERLQAEGLPSCRDRSRRLH
jgi:excisionase family DNA binding protein